MLRKWVLFGGLFAAATAVLVGCNNSQPPTEKAAEPKAAPAKADEEHGHKPGAHGGTLVSLGKDSYHAEAVFDKNGAVRLYTLGKDEARVQEVEAQELSGYATAVGSNAGATEVKFAAKPQQGDSAGKTSLFVGQLPTELVGQTVQITINNIRIGGERFRIAFSNTTSAHADAPMPDGVGSDESKKLYLTPGGKYTAEDIKANGSAPAAVKYKGIKSDHNAKPQPGDKICPVSMTKANPKFTWVVGGKTYEFCCVPCIDEFVQAAKSNPSEIKAPTEYIKK
ncbi:Uncharacterized protein OS=Singulisphaera acidiphila (strain ATCC BAA-1392 / DSM 18658 / VKM B-2454 / MOB10) GN=Sinac_4511 PE=4 SV=1 [Gemmata massiliana]|uniref:TRASH domain-containing protein n=1 Tax=Gemmata massiliana TaxID=1210884 RepID=A0A6P2D5K8_9BACT|nr:hypothetical protein [Gemmata massiliana]VTR95384.1 Uncharacterized protein OS=Singulisphaera acidiphila (strain ATCC BAA-1392 / DSM 18658 / VKM B-2454 / MOB10) GN=Sinac_4511 PE=4 SV=1 [Gemmata massiliana]